MFLKMHPARQFGLSSVVVGLIVVAFNIYMITSLGGPGATALVAPFLILFGASMAACPGTGTPEKTDGPITTSIKTLRGLAPWEGAVWAGGAIGGIILGVVGSSWL